MPDPNADSITARARIACPVCGVPIPEHSPECPRHDYLPRVVTSGYVATKAAGEAKAKRTRGKRG